MEFDKQYQDETNGIPQSEYDKITLPKNWPKFQILCGTPRRSVVG